MISDSILSGRSTTLSFPLKKTIEATFGNRRNSGSVLEPVRAGDTPLLVPMLDRTLDRVEVHEIVGDKGFDEDQLRCDCLNRDVNPNIPWRVNRDPEV